MAAIPTRRAIWLRSLPGASAAPLIVASVTGTDADPQPRDAQVQKLAEAGVIVADSNADATEAAIAALGAALIHGLASTDVIVPILRAGVLAQEFCRTSRARTSKPFSSACFYLRCGDQFICVGEPDIGNGPLTLIGNLGPLSDLDLRPGRSAAVCERHITHRQFRSASRSTKVNRGVLLPWPTCPSPARLIDTCAALARRAAIDAPQKALRVTSLACLKRPGSAAAGARRPPAHRDVRTLVIRGARRRGHSGHWCREAVQGLIGLGPGLTPSGDDFLVGALAMLDAIGERDAHAALARAIIDALPGDDVR